MRVRQTASIAVLALLALAGTSCSLLLDFPFIDIKEMPRALPPPPAEATLSDTQRAELALILAPGSLPEAPPQRGPIFINFIDRAEDGLYVADGPNTDLPVSLVLRIEVPGLKKPVEARAVYKVTDFYGRLVSRGLLGPTVLEPAEPADLTLHLPDVNTLGVYSVEVRVEAGAKKATAVHQFGIIPAPAQTEAAESPFGVAGTINHAAQYARLGAKHLLAYFADGRNVANFQKVGEEGWQPEYNWFVGVRRLETLGGTGLELLPIIGFGPAELKSEAARQASQERFGNDNGVPYGPPADAAIFAQWAAGTVEYFADDIPRWQIWRDPAPGGWTWAAGHEEFRDLIAEVCRELGERKIDVEMAFAATPEGLADAVEAGWKPPTPLWCGLAMYQNSTDSSLAGGEFAVSLKEAVEAARRLKLNGVYISETGESPYHGTAQQRAWKLVIRHAEALRCGVSRVYVQDNMGLRNPKTAAVAYAVLTHALAGKRFSRNASAASDETINAPIFADKHGSVAIVWSYNEEGGLRALVIDNAGGFKATDAAGSPVGIWDSRRLIVPVGEAPVYLVARGMSAGKIAESLKRAKTIGLEAKPEEKTQE
ncbi:MAG: hypothetical protein QF662_05790 [Phycisphaerae bacterium]|nr:hypothetical protein [Phycisphaerae bacterium]